MGSGGRDNAEVGGADDLGFECVALGGEDSEE